MQRVQARGTHHDEHITAARLDGDATRVLEPGDSARAVEEALGAAAGERGGRPGGDVDTADLVVVSVLRCIMGQHTEEMLVNRRSVAALETAVRPLRRVRGGAVCGNGWRDAGARGRPTHRDEREGAARVDRDATRVLEPGDSARAVEEASRAGAGERGGRPGRDVDTADPAVPLVLRCIMGQRTEEMLVNRRSVAALETGAAPTPCARRCRLRDCGMRGHGGGRRTATSAKVPLGSMATPNGPSNRALPRAPSRKPLLPLPASVVVAPVAMSTRRMRLPLWSCDASWDNALRKC
eukprot:scaffold13055_cov56-Phaeocystis_antarctica.AAC.4